MSQSFKHSICKIKGAFLASTGLTSSKNEVSRISGLPPIDVVINQRRHSLFGHVRRMDSRAPAYQAIHLAVNSQHTLWFEARQQLEKTTRTSAQFLGQADHHQQHHLTSCLDCCNGSVDADGATTQRWSSVAERGREREF